jgi:hypothetical protein
VEALLFHVKYVYNNAGGERRLKTYTSLDLQQRADGIERVVGAQPVERKAVVRRGLPEDPLGYDTTDIKACTLSMADAALSGRNRAFVEAEIAAAKKRFGSVE